MIARTALLDGAPYLIATVTAAELDFSAWEDQPLTRLVVIT